MPDTVAPLGISQSRCLWIPCQNESTRLQICFHIGLVFLSPVRTFQVTFCHAVVSHSKGCETRSPHCVARRMSSFQRPAKFVERTICVSRAQEQFASLLMQNRSIPPRNFCLERDQFAIRTC